MKSVVEFINANSNIPTWTVSELRNIYTESSGDLSRKQMLSKLCEYYGEQLVVINVPGCETEAGLVKNIRGSLKMVKKTMMEGDSAEELTRRIKAEVTGINQPHHYDLSEFTYQKILDATSTTLLSLISQLVSDGKVTKKSLSLAQCIQQHIGASRWNQTSLGLAIKLHHKFGSSELLQTLHSHGLICSYDEVMRFRKSAAHFVSTNSNDFHKLLGLTTETGPIFSWMDNYDLWIASPNGTKTTHAMVSESLSGHHLALPLFMTLLLV